MIVNPVVSGSGSQDLTSYFKDFITKNGKHVVLNGASMAIVTCDPPSDDWYSAFHIISPESGEYSVLANKNAAGQIASISSNDGSFFARGFGSSEMVIENYEQNKTVEIYVWYSIPCEISIEERE